MGDAALAALLPGLYQNSALESLVLRSCALTDRAGRAVASVLRWHAVALDCASWQAGLRGYPGPPGAPPPTPRGPLAPAGGLIWLDLSANALTNASVAALCAALRHETRLCGADLGANALTLSAGIALHEAMSPSLSSPSAAAARGCGSALQFVDLRRNPEAELGVIMRGADGVVRHAARGPALAALAEGAEDAWEARQGAASNAQRNTTQHNAFPEGGTSPACFSQQLAPDALRRASTRKGVISLCQFPAAQCFGHALVLKRPASLPTATIPPCNRPPQDVQRSSLPQRQWAPARDWGAGAVAAGSRRPPADEARRPTSAV